MKTTKILDNPLEADFFVSANISAQEQLLQTEQKTTISSRSSSTVINREDGLTDAREETVTNSPTTEEDHTPRGPNVVSLD